MNIKVISIGKTNKSYLVEGEQEYLKRLKKYVSFEKVEIPDIKGAKKMSQKEIKQKEGQLLLSKMQPTDFVILLDDKGKMRSSVEFSNWLQSKMNLSIKTMAFVIGGAYGFSDEVYARGQEKISLSKMTFSHQMIRMLFFEQIYRAFSILNNEPYHHE
ncbi:MAG: 23S rRNA (pseudouridine(1915)-N(3))-methyltransferase RlmH [Putridiphycobacter sp.]|nr:23S rRNA (pseudouridine(1915)-N(3))-methyltransferase RlmH [Putridiphycobacter sp.]